MTDFSRLQLLVGSECFDRLQSTRVALFGVGGVGSWCAESLIRSGIKDLTLVDFDDVAPSNINRQLPALQSTIGRPKAQVMAERLHDINPDASIQIRLQKFDVTIVSEWNFNDYDIVIDCIDSLDCKALLLHKASYSSAKVYSSMGAGRKIDPFQIKTSELWKVRDCPLGHALRRYMRKNGLDTAQKIKCVYSTELAENKGYADMVEKGLIQAPSRINGTIAHITAIFGFTLAGLVIQDSLLLASNKEKVLF